MAEYLQIVGIETAFQQQGFDVRPAGVTSLSSTEGQEHGMPAEQFAYLLANALLVRREFLRWLVIHQGQSLLGRQAGDLPPEDQVGARLPVLFQGTGNGVPVLASDQHLYLAADL